MTRGGVAVGQFPNCLIERGPENVLSHLPGPVVRLESTLGDDLDCPTRTQSASQDQTSNQKEKEEDEETYRCSEGSRA